MSEAAAWLTCARRLAAAPDDAAALAWLARDPAPPDRPPAPPPPDLAARPAPLPAVAWHAQRLCALAAAGPPLERRYHARWLWHLLAPDQPEAWPLISVVIPVFNRHDLMLEAVASVLATGYPRLQLCICDDGSDSDPLPLLAHLGERLRYRRLAVNAGSPTARQRALELAEGELVQFLDTDDLLLPGSLTRKVAALAAVPDAEICFCTMDLLMVDPPPGVTGRDGSRPPGWPGCVTMEGVRAAVRRQPFLPSATLVARHRMLQVGFATWLRHHEDRLAFAQLALAGVKTIGLKEFGTLRRWLPSSESRQIHDPLNQLADVLLLLLDASLDRPHLWPVCGPLFATLFNPDWVSLLRSRQPAHEVMLDHLLRRLEALAEQPPDGLSAAPLIADLAAGLQTQQGRQPRSAYAEALAARLAALLPLAAAPGPADLVLWRDVADPTTVPGGLRLLFAQLSAALRRGRPWVPISQLDQRPFRSLNHPAKRRWKMLAKLARWLGEPPAQWAGRLFG